ncbi:hypothetical protein Z945_397 [Sulfitobacter noctilucae]|nr:hypothetical protein Z945_397 [Sulfitobacter noctilucae]
MLNIYANSMMHATRTGCVTLRDMPKTTSSKRKRWFSRNKTRCVNPNEL